MVRKQGYSTLQCMYLIVHDCATTFCVCQVFPDNFMKREVLALKVHCPQKNEGCNWKGEVRELEVSIRVYTCDLYVYNYILQLILISR